MRPNILVLMVDQLSGTLFPDGPAPFLHAPNLAALAARSRRFSCAYAASPLCAPSRASFMAGQLPSRTRVYDNAAEFAADIPTYAHWLRRAGYQTSLVGKMHFIGPDQLHGFEERLTTDIYPADFGWTPDYERPGQRIDWWYHNLGSVTGAGTAEITNQLEYDDDVAHLAIAKLRDMARRRDARPWCMTVSFTHPHDPYVARDAYWSLYDDCPALDPVVPPVPAEEQDAHSRRLLEASDAAAFAIRPEDVRRARQGHFASISYVDDQIGAILGVLERTGMTDETVVLFVSDHGDMLGERGLWFKMSFREGSARVPLMIAGPGIEAGRVDTPVSLLDVVPTLTEVAGVGPAVVAPWTDGESLMGEGRQGAVPMEYAAEGSVAPMVALREGRFKLILCEADPPLLFDLEADPHEETNLAGLRAHRATLDRLTAVARARWDLAAYDAAVRESQARRRIVYEALRSGRYHPWDFEPQPGGADRYMRNHMNLDILEAERRYPRAAGPDARAAQARNPQ